MPIVQQGGCIVACSRKNHNKNSSTNFTGESTSGTQLSVRHIQYYMHTHILYKENTKLIKLLGYCFVIQYVVKYWRGKILANLATDSQLAKILPNQNLPQVITVKSSVSKYFTPPIFRHIHYSILCLCLCCLVF